MKSPELWTLHYVTLSDSCLILQLSPKSSVAKPSLFWQNCLLYQILLDVSRPSLKEEQPFWWRLKVYIQMVYGYLLEQPTLIYIHHPSISNLCRHVANKKSSRKFPSRHRSWEIYSSPGTHSIEIKQILWQENMARETTLANLLLKCVLFICTNWTTHSMSSCTDCFNNLTLSTRSASAADDTFIFFSNIFSKISELWNIVTVFRFSTDYGSKWVQTCLCLVQWFFS